MELKLDRSAQQRRSRAGHRLQGRRQRLRRYCQRHEVAAATAAASGGGGKWQRLLAALEMDFGVGLAAGRGPEPLVAEFALVGQRTGVESHVDLNEVDLTVKILTSRD